MSANNPTRYVGVCVDCQHLRPSEYRLLCPKCARQALEAAREVWARTPTRNVGQHKARPEQEVGQ
jgi:hypothetical protein